MTVDTRPPLYLTAGEAARWMSLHPEDQGRDVVIVETHIRPCPVEYLTKPPRPALGWNARGEWVWLGEEEGRWP